MPLPAIILICVGCALILAGLVFLGVRLYALIKAARKAGIRNSSDVQEIIARVQRLEPRFRELEKNQAALAESLQRLSAEAALLNYLKEELDRRPAVSLPQEVDP
jgi:predicted nuclease with TOPRIM domain